MMELTMVVKVESDHRRCVIPEIFLEVMSMDKAEAWLAMAPSEKGLTTREEAPHPPFY